MSCSFCLVCLEKVIGSDSHGEELLHQLPDDPCVIIDSFEKNGLAAERDSGICEPGTGKARFRRDLIRVIEMGVDEQRVEASQEICQFGCDALRKRAGDPGSDPDDFNVRDGSEFRKDSVEFFVCQKQRISS